MRTREPAPVVEQKATDSHKRLEQEPKQEPVARHSAAALRLISQPDEPPLSGIQRARRIGAAFSAHDILQLQRRYGNRYFQKLLKSSASRAEPKGPAKPGVHPASAAAGPESDSQNAQSRIESRVRAKSESGERHVGSDVEQSLLSSKGSGTPLPKGVRSSMESAFGADFRRVNIHTGSDAVEMTTQLGAQAFTHGSDIYFNQGKYAPESTSGKHLLAHELTHTVQQGASAFRAQPNGPGVQPTTITPKIQGSWYNFHIPFTDYEFDPSLEGLKTAGNLAVDKAKEGATWVKDKVVEAAEWVVDRVKSLINAGIEWLTKKFNEIQEFAKSSFADIKGAVSSALGAITSPLGAITNAIGAMDAGVLSAAWRALTAGANAAWQAVKVAVNGVLKFGGGIWETVSKYVDSMFNTVGNLLDSRAFNVLPDFVQAPIRGLYKSVRDLWTSIRNFWTDFWKRLTSFVKELLDSMQAFVQKVVSYAIDKVIETVKKLKQAYELVKRYVTDPEAVIKPILTTIAGKIKAEAPGKAKEVAQQKSAEAWAKQSSRSSGTLAVQRSPDGSAATRSTTSHAVVDENVNKALSDQWAALDIPKMLWDTVVNMFWPPATIRAIGHEFYELWNTDWKNAAKSLFKPRNIFDDFGGFWHDVWSNFLILLDFPLALWRRLNSILMLLMGYVTIILILVGGGAGAALAWAIGEALFVSFLLAESSSALKAFLDLYTARQTAEEKQRDYVQIAASVIGIGIAFAIAILFSLLGVLAREVVGRIKARGGGPPKELPKGQEGTDTEGSKQEKKTEAEIVPGKAALEADIKTAQADAAALRDTIKQTPRAEERAPLDARAAEIQQELARLQEDAGRAANADDVQRRREQLDDIRNKIDALRNDATVAEVPGRLTLQQDVAAARQRVANIRQRIDGLTGNDQQTLRPQLDSVDAELRRVEQAAQNVPTLEQAQRLREALDSARKSMDDIEHNPLLELGLRGEALNALESLENIKKDPVGDINKKISERGNPKNHYEAARREARGEVVFRENGRPVSHIGDLQRAYDGLNNVRRALQREIDRPPGSMTERGLEVLLNKFSEVQGIMSRLKGFLDSIGQGDFPPYHTFPPGT